MAGLAAHRSLTVRERRGVVVPLTIWVAATVLTSLAGPFQTYKILSLFPRLAYWAVVCGAAVLMDIGFRRVFGGPRILRRLGARLAYAAALGALVYLLNSVVFPGWGGLAALVWLIGVVWVVAIAIEGLVVLSRPAQLAEPEPAQPKTENPDAAFQDRLPHDKRGPLVRLEAQDHYLKAVTLTGEALILMRLSDAETELAGVAGLRVHRSHWVALGQVRKVQRRDGRMVLEMADGAEVPVSRTYRPAAEAAGLTI